MLFATLAIIVFLLSPTLNLNAETIVVENFALEETKLSKHYLTTYLEVEKNINASHLDDLIKLAPGVTSAGGTSRSRFFQIRGIGERSSYEGMPNQSVGFSMDEIDYTGSAGIFDLSGVQTIEVYKGPQNTLSGPSFIAGAIKAISITPKDNSLKLNITKENYSGESLSLTQTLLKEDFKVSFSARYYAHDGFYENTHLNKKDTNKKQEISLKNKTILKNFELNLHYFDFKSGYDVFNLENTKQTRSDHPGRDDQKTFGSSFIHNLERNNYQLKSVLSGHITNTAYFYDEDWGNEIFWQNYPGWNDSYDYKIEFTNKTQSLNWEEKVIWQVGKFFNTTGLFYKNLNREGREKGFNQSSTRKDLKSSLKRNRWSIFHESEYSTTPYTTIFAGLRLTSLLSTYEDNQETKVSPKEILWGGHFGVKNEYFKHFSSIRLSKGFKAGGVNIGSNINSERQEFQNETLYSLDLQYRFTDKHIRIMLSPFFTQRENVQVKTSFQDDPSDPSSFSFYTDNATTGNSYGAEWSLSYDTKNLYTIQLSGNIMDSQYGNYTYGERNLKDRQFPYAPNYQVSLTQSFNFLKSYFFKATQTASDSFYFGNSHDEKAPSSLVTDLSLGINKKNFTFSLWTKNAFQERRETRGFYFGNRPPNFENERFTQIGAPRTFGATLKMDI